MKENIAAITRWLAPLAVLFFGQTGLTVTVDQAALDLPNAINFHLEAASAVWIDSAQIEVRTDALVCGQSATLAAPDSFNGGNTITADWQWDLVETGSLPPGTTVTWRWNLTADSGEVFRTPEQQIVIADENYTWQTLESDTLALHWYEGSADFAQAMLSAGLDALDRLETLLGVPAEGQIRVYIYASPGDMQDATLYAPAWSGGLAYAEFNTALLAVPPREVDWGRRALAHELTHVVVGHYTFSCVTSTPPWFDEGLAMYMEGDPDPYYESLLDQAIRDDELLSVRELGTIFSGDPELASLSYAQSLSLVTFLVEDYGQDRLLLLLDQFRDGASEDTALEEVYGVDRDGLDAAWREWAGAQPMEAEPPGSAPTITPFPTLPPISGPPLAGEEVLPTPHYLTEAPSDADSGGLLPAGLDQTAIMVGVTLGCLVMAGLIGFALVGLGLWLGRRRKSGGGPYP